MATHSDESVRRAAAMKLGHDGAGARASTATRDQAALEHGAGAGKAARWRTGSVGMGAWRGGEMIP